MTLVDFTIEDEELFILLKRQCLNGVLSEFTYLVNTRLEPQEKKDIFEQRDEHGCILLHYAAQGGNTNILDEILSITSHKFLEIRCIRGQSALHFAIKHAQKEMIEHLIKLYSGILSKKNQNAESTATDTIEENKCKPVEKENNQDAESTATDINGENRCKPVEKEKNQDSESTATDINEENKCKPVKKEKNQDSKTTATDINEENKCKPVDKEKNQDAETTLIHQKTECDIARWEFSPVHLAAWFGDTRLLNSLKAKGFDILTKTRNGLNILDIACMKNLCEESDVQYSFCEYLLSNEELNIDPSKTDMSGWNIAHYASLSNFKLFKYLADIGNKIDLIKKPTKALKTCMHIACEFEKIKIVKFIAENTQLQTLIPDKNALGWNALHFAAKGGNLDILEYLLNLKKEGMDIGCKTNDGKTLLHIACIHKKTEICDFVITQFKKNKSKYKELLNAKTTNNGLTAAHYLAVEKKQDGSEKQILEMLINTKQMDFSAKSKKGLTVLEFAIDHLNKELIECIVSAKYRQEFKINIAILDKCKNDTKDNEIKQVLEAARDEIKS